MFYPPAYAAQALAKLTVPQARAQFGDRVARAFLTDTNPDAAPPFEFKQQLAYNAFLATELRKVCPRVFG